MPGPFYAVLLACVVLFTAAAEIWSLQCWNRYVSVRCQIDMRLTEPGEVATLSYRLCNTSRWPLTSVSVSFLFDSAVELREEDRGNSSDDRARNMYTVDTFLLPHRVFRGTVHLSFRERGCHMPGRIYVETGDLLGLRTKLRSFDLPFSVICTAAPAEEQPELRPLGGFLGDISVRRFILEDPSILLGYREYTGYEPMKAISWLQTARTGHLMVKQHDFTVDTDVAVLVDLEACKKAVAERCLSLARTVCDELERLRIPYVVLSNGDLYAGQKGVGRVHNFEIQRRIGLCRFLRRQAFPRLLSRCAAEGAGKGYIVIVPALCEEIEAGVRLLRSASGAQVCVLTGKEAEADA